MITKEIIPNGWNPEDYEKMYIFFKHPKTGIVEQIDCEIKNGKAICLIDEKLENYLFDKNGNLRIQ